MTPLHAFPLRFHFVPRFFPSKRRSFELITRPCAFCLLVFPSCQNTDCCSLSLILAEMRLFAFLPPSCVLYFPPTEKTFKVFRFIAFLASNSLNGDNPATSCTELKSRRPFLAPSFCDLTGFSLRVPYLCPCSESPDPSQCDLRGTDCCYLAHLIRLKAAPAILHL